ncbi:MAG: N-acetyl-gamma-glutamyl-phosphate reductase [Nitrospiria bacterium]
MKVGIIGATGYTGGELLRLLRHHPKADVICVTSERSAGQPLVERHPFLNGHYDLRLEALHPEKIAKKADFLFIALSHTQAMAPVFQFIASGKKVVDLSADFRLRSGKLYEKWYGTAHACPSLLKRSVYGLPEIYRKKIARATLVANPGCYPTGALLPIIPFLKQGLIDPSREIIVDAKSGVSGAGRSPKETTHFPEVNEGHMAYGIGMHRHLPEIIQEITRNGEVRPKVLFTPHLLPINRGILTTIYFPLRARLSQKRISSVLSSYKKEVFIRLIKGSPNVAHVRGSNDCHITGIPSPSGRTAILISAIDNLGKGAAGQAIQNMNIMMGWEECLGLHGPGLFP